MKNLFLLVAFSVLASGAWAQNVEITPFAGYRFGGGFTDLTTSGSSVRRNIAIDQGVSFCLVVDVPLSETFQFEFLFDRQDSQLVGLETSGTEDPLFDAKVNYYHAGFLIHGRSVFHPFFAITTGATHFQTPDEVDDEIRTSMGLAVGGKTRFNERIGARLQARFVGTYIGSNDQLLCGSPSGCYTKLNDTIMRQLDLSGGVIFHF